jgi:hypothetical protein
MATSERGPNPNDNQWLDWLTNATRNIEAKKLFAPLANPSHSDTEPKNLPLVAAAQARDRETCERIKAEQTYKPTMAELLEAQSWAGRGGRR